MISVSVMTKGDTRWEDVAEFAYNCSWGAGKNMARFMREKELLPWERVIAAFEDNEVAGYCTFSETDCIPDVPYTPYIGFVFVGERFRGARISEKMIISALDYAKGLGYTSVYLVSDQKNLYEKYGFVKIDEKPAPWDISEMETIFVHSV